MNATQKAKSRQLLPIVSTVLTLAWPFVVWLAVAHPQLRWLPPVVLAVIFLLRLCALKRHAGALNSMGKLLAVGGTALCISSLLLCDYQLLLYYPVLVNGGMLLLFGYSLCYGMPLVEQLARWREPELPVAAVRYTRQVTQVWCLFFIFNGGIALATCLHGDMRLWTLWNGMISYLLMALLMAVEWLIRQRMRKLT